MEEVLQNMVRISCKDYMVLDFTYKKVWEVVVKMDLESMMLVIWVGDRALGDKDM